MFPQADIVRWRAVAPWADDDDDDVRTSPSRWPCSISSGTRASVVLRLFAVPDPPVGNSAAVPTYDLDELLATKLRALYQRRKGRDLFDLWWAHQEAEPDPTRMVAILSEYQAAAGRPMIRASELRSNLAAKRVPSFLDEVRPLLRPGVTYDPVAALDWVESTFVPLLR